MQTKRSKLKPPEKIDENQHISMSFQVSIDRFARILAVLAVNTSNYRKKPNTQRIPFLANLGFDKDDIAAILDTTPGTVQKQLSISGIVRRPKKNNGKEK